MNIRAEIVIKKIIQYADEIDETISRFNLTHESFTEDFIARNAIAIAMCILQIGEPVGKLSERFKAENRAKPWREIKTMRNIAAHNYGEIDIDILCETATCDIPDMQEYCQRLVS
mgnify:CR=1 FL=1